MEGNISPAIWQLPNQCSSNNQQTGPNESQGYPEKEKVMQKFGRIAGVKENNLKSS